MKNISNIIRCIFGIPFIIFIICIVYPISFLFSGHIDAKNDVYELISDFKKGMLK